MSITIYGEILVPLDLPTECIQELKDAFQASELDVNIERDGLTFPYISIGYWIDGEFHEPGFNEASKIVYGLGYRVICHDESRFIHTQ